MVDVPVQTTSTCSLLVDTSYGLASFAKFWILSIRSSHTDFSRFFRDSRTFQRKVRESPKKKRRKFMGKQASQAKKQK